MAKDDAAQTPTPQAKRHRRAQCEVGEEVLREAGIGHVVRNAAVLNPPTNVQRKAGYMSAKEPPRGCRSMTLLRTKEYPVNPVSRLASRPWLKSTRHFGTFTKLA